MMRQIILELAHEQLSRWPALELRDLVKALYQSAFGSGHFIADEARALAFMREEMETAPEDAPLFEELMGGYSRVHLGPCRTMGVSPETLTTLFILAACDGQNAVQRADFQEMLATLESLCDAGELPFDGKKAREELAAYRAAGCPAVHHSRAFRETNRPAYRIVCRGQAQLLPLFARIDTLLAQKERVIVAIDGNSGAGKSTLGGLLKRVYGGAVLVHMDDFFLQPHQRTAARLNTPGGNVDHERFLSEVLLPMRAGKPIDYRPYDCRRQEILPGREIAPGKLCIVEGSYSLHPELEGQYDLKVALRMDKKTQEERIRARENVVVAQMFLECWIPLEDLYFDATDIDARCDMRIRVSGPKDSGPYCVMTKAEGNA